MPSKQTSERCERTSERTSEWPSTSVCLIDLAHSAAAAVGGLYCLYCLDCSHRRGIKLPLETAWKPADRFHTIFRFLHARMHAKCGGFRFQLNRLQRIFFRSLVIALTEFLPQMRSGNQHAYWSLFLMACFHVPGPILIKFSPLFRDSTSV